VTRLPTGVPTPHPTGPPHQDQEQEQEQRALLPPPTEAASSVEPTTAVGSEPIDQVGKEGTAGRAPARARRAGGRGGAPRAQRAGGRPACGRPGPPQRPARVGSGPDR
jgi:hypothetical protein